MNPQPVSTPAPAPASPAAVNPKINRIASDVIVDGKVRFQGQLFVNGRIKGEIHSDGQLVVEGQAVLDANIKAASVIVEGTVTGNIEASKEVKLAPSAKVIGNISTAILTMDSGSVFTGQASVGKPTIAG